MATETFRIALQKGIEGGFAPPTPHALYTITRFPAGSDVFSISSQTRPHGTPHLLPPSTRELKVADHAESIAMLLYLLGDLPVQYPGAQDLYGRNISITYTDKTNFVDSPRSGMAAGAGVPYPTEEQKARFDEAVAIIERLAAV